ncbi:hypothetical protein PVAP13_1NG140100 [Panicum virgatum]|uniref:Uncharacterized protein n=1 Tax=Panicum virgatum TaxID=38727 RepID=A0A8T0WKS5_PANVG|nr:hypothetical protein PVAP13_1NG140100 [Panicum virgatum]
MFMRQPAWKPATLRCRRMWEIVCVCEKSTHQAIGSRKELGTVCVCGKSMGGKLAVCCKFHQRPPSVRSNTAQGCGKKL